VPHRCGGYGVIPGDPGRQRKKSFQSLTPRGLTIRTSRPSSRQRIAAAFAAVTPASLASLSAPMVTRLAIGNGGNSRAIMPLVDPPAIVGRPFICLKESVLFRIFCDVHRLCR